MSNYQSGSGVLEQVTEAVVLAAEWRKDSAYTDRGWVLVWGGLVQGWSDSIPPANEWRPSTIIVDIGDDVYMAWGGTDQDGAKEWRLIEGH